MSQSGTGEGALAPGFEFFEHTADVGVRVVAPTLAALVEAAGKALYAVIGELMPEGEPRPERFEFTGEAPALLLRQYLAELLLLFEQEQRMITRLEVEVFEPGQLIVRGESRPVSRSGSHYDREVKAVTYHGLDIRPIPGGYEGTFIVDV